MSTLCKLFSLSFAAFPRYDTLAKHTFLPLHFLFSSTIEQCRSRLHLDLVIACMSGTDTRRLVRFCVYIEHLSFAINYTLHLNLNSITKHAVSMSLTLTCHGIHTHGIERCLSPALVRHTSQIASPNVRLNYIHSTRQSDALDPQVSPDVTSVKLGRS